MGGRGLVEGESEGEGGMKGEGCKMGNCFVQNAIFPKCKTILFANRDHRNFRQIAEINTFMALYMYSR